jgi:hypothetical protein
MMQPRVLPAKTVAVRLVLLRSRVHDRIILGGNSGKLMRIKAGRIRNRKIAGQPTLFLEGRMRELSAGDARRQRSRRHSLCC